MMSVVVPRSCLRLAVVAAFLLGFSTAAFAQAKTNVGRGKCVDCHDHKDEKEWSQTRDGDGKGKQHFNALNQLNDPKAPDLAKAIGVADPYDTKSTCVKCHATTTAIRARNAAELATRYAGITWFARGRTRRPSAGSTRR